MEMYTPTKWGITNILSNNSRAFSTANKIHQATVSGLALNFKQGEHKAHQTCSPDERKQTDEKKTEEWHLQSCE